MTFQMRYSPEGEMKSKNKIIYLKRRGAVLIISMIFILVFAALAVSMASLSGVNVQIADNQRKVNLALSAAQSGLQAGCYLANKYSSSDEVLKTPNLLKQSDKNATWDKFCTYLQNHPVGGATWSRNVNECSSSDISFGDGSKTSLKFNYDGNSILLQSIGRIPPFDNPVIKKVSMAVEIKRNNDVLKYAIASRGRMWLTGNTTVYGDVYSPWNRPEISPYNMTSDSRIEGTINTVLTREAIEAHHSGYPDYQLETLNADGLPIDVNGNPLGTNYQDRYYGPDDQIQAYHEGINYGQPNQDIPGMDISDYETSSYNSGLGSIPTSSQTVVEYFPHAAGNYNYPRDGTPYFTPNRKLNRQIYENQTFSNAYLSGGRNALFKDCTFDDVLYIDCAKSGSGSSSTYYNNVRFENCTFNGVIITNVPQLFKWQYNCLYFTGEATFNNQSGIQEATILAPHFNVNLGNTNPQQSDNNILTGAIIGGIVDVRGNAQIYGTIISMCDTSQWDEGYVTNIGATLNDGGSETTDPGDAGIISITPEEDKMLPSGITSPIVIEPLQNTYSEGA
jgi:hypothetical protein